jgi:Spy/CpxP family protein refolding chaperone
VLSHSKMGLAVLALALSCGPALAQGDSPADPPSAPDSIGHGRMHQGGPGRDGGWGRREGREDGRFGGGHRMGMRGDRMGGREFGLGRLLSDPAIRDQIGVTADQAAKIRQQEADFRKTEIRDHADLEVKRIDLRELMAADNPDRAAIDAKLTEISTSRLALERAAVGFRLNSRNALTPDQRQKLQELVRNRQGREGGPAGPGPRGRGPGGRRANAPPPNQPNPPAPATP